jgi:cyanophycinase
MPRPASRTHLRCVANQVATVIVLFFLLAPAQAADAPAIDPTGLPGPLVIGGGKGSAEMTKAFFDLAGKGKAKIVVIPTAVATADDPKTTDALLEPWKALEPASVEILHTRDPKRADDPDFVKPLTEATGVWFTNGHTDRLLNAYRGTLVEKELKKLHARGGVIGGAGGGANVMGSLVLAGGKEKPVEGFGILPGFIIERKESLEGLIADHPTHVGLRFPDGTALVIRGRVARVIGEPAVTLCVTRGAGKPVATETYETDSLLDIVQLRRAVANRAAKEPFPPAKAGEPVVPKGTLVLLGGGRSTPEMWKRFIDASGGPEALIVFVPTADEDRFLLMPAEDAILKKVGAKNVVRLHTRDPKKADDPAFSEVLTKAGGVWFGSGRQWRLVDAYAGTLTEKRFHEVLARGGAIGGGSAGASVQGEYMPRGHPLGNTVVAAEGYERGFGFLPGCAVDQHFFARERTADMTGLMKKYPQYLGIGIDEGVALVVTGGTAEVLGRSTVGFYHPRASSGFFKDYDELWAGEKYDLKARKKIGK